MRTGQWRLALVGDEPVPPTVGKITPDGFDPPQPSNAPIATIASSELRDQPSGLAILFGTSTLGTLTARSGLVVVGLAPGNRLSRSEGPKIAWRCHVPRRMYGGCPADSTAAPQRRRAVVGDPDQVAEIAHPAEEGDGNQYRCEDSHGDHVRSLRARSRAFGDGWVSVSLLGGGCRGRRTF